MHIRLALFVIVLALAACGGSSAADPTTAEQPMTTAAPTTTTVATTTVTTSVLIVPSEDDRSSYILVSALLLDSTEFSVDEMGTDAWGVMIRDGAIGACLALAGGRSLTDAIAAVIENTPSAGLSHDDYTAGEFSAVVAVIAGGPKIYCPTVAPNLPSDTREAAEVLFAAWQEFLERDS